MKKFLVLVFSLVFRNKWCLIHLESGFIESMGSAKYFMELQQLSGLYHEFMIGLLAVKSVQRSVQLNERQSTLLFDR